MNTIFFHTTDEDVHVKEIFRGTENIEDFLTTNGLTEEEVSLLLEGILNVASMIPSLGNQRLKPITCNPQMLASYLITDDLEAVKEISNALCNLNTNQITQLTDLIQTNLDTETLINRGEEAANRTLSYNMTRLQNISNPDILNPELRPRGFQHGMFQP